MRASEVRLARRGAEKIGRGGLKTRRRSRITRLTESEESTVGPAPEQIVRIEGNFSSAAKAPKSGRKSAEQRHFEKRRAIESRVMDLRDLAIELVRTHSTYQRVEEEGGATAHTLRKWEEGKVKQPQMPTLLATLDTLGLDIAIVRKGSVDHLQGPARSEQAGAESTPTR